jgi:acyl-coenzyme A synthetase/AMP-(fatty) acid ligase
MKFPDDFVFVDKIPHTATEKIQKITLPKQFEAHRQQSLL